MIIGFVPNNVHLKINNKKYIRGPIPLPIVTGFLGLTGFIFSPLLITNYFINSSYLDKLFDKYDINIKRYHQYDENDNKYAYPSIINIEITNKIQ